MKIELKEITVEELCEGYEDSAENGVRAYGGKLDVRPPYQREFIYKEAQRSAVIDTVMKGFPLNVMYWSVREDGTYEIIDGQQRTISLCQYMQGEFSVDKLYIHNLQDDIAEKIKKYKLMIYFCSGTDSERLEWFKTINIAGEKLTDQELRNAVYAGTWVTDAKRYFSRTNCPASNYNRYLSGAANRQEYLETAIKWINSGKIEDYMGIHQNDPNAVELWNYFSSVMEWVKSIFPTYRREMKGIEWGEIYNKYKNDKSLDGAKLDKEVARLMEDEDVTNKKGIYWYVLSKEEKYLNIRAFSDNIKREVYEKQGGKCKKCGKSFDISEMEADHIIPWCDGGKTEIDNCQMLCKSDNRTKGGK